MARRWKQVELPMPPTWGGARRGAGRPRIAGRRPPVAHRRRSPHVSRFPVHVTLRAIAGLGTLRASHVFEGIREALRAATSDRLRVIHFSVQDDHIHIIAEASEGDAMSLGLRGLVVRVARAVNKALRRKGPVWGDRYHAHDLRSPSETRTALLYVLQNWKKHIRGTRGIDERSSGLWFDGWASKREWQALSPCPVAAPRTWLAARGWRDKGGGPLRLDEGPARGG